MASIENLFDQATTTTYGTFGETDAISFVNSLSDPRSVNPATPLRGAYGGLKATF